MGNTLRSTLGNLCGGQASKDIDGDIYQRPVAKPKKEKKEKKNKKNKKNKQENNGNLEQIEEEKDERNEKPTEQNNANDNRNKEEKRDVKLEEVSTDQSAKLLTLKERASESSLSNLIAPEKHQADVDNIDGNGDEEEVSDITDNDSIENRNITNLHLSEQGQISDKRLDFHQGTFCSDDVIDSKAPLSSAEAIDNKFDHIHLVEEISPEVLTISYADEIFSNAKNCYQPFVEKSAEFKNAVLEFGKSVDPGKIKPDFEKCCRLYTDLLDEENNRSAESTNPIRSKSKVDVCDVNANLQAIRCTGTALLATINEVRPKYENYVTSAGNVDVIEHVKSKMIEGEQLGITSKFSAPGKYRRNMKQLKNALRLLNDVERDAKDILKLVEKHLASMPSKNVVHDEISIEPITKTDDTDDDMFAKLEDISSIDTQKNTFT